MAVLCGRVECVRPDINRTATVLPARGGGGGTACHRAADGRSPGDVVSRQPQLVVMRLLSPNERF